MAPEPALLDRPRSPSTPPPLDWLTLGDAFEVACLLRCTPPPTAARPRRGPGRAHRAGCEFNREDAAQRMRQLLDRLDIPVDPRGGRRRPAPPLRAAPAVGAPGAPGGVRPAVGRGLAAGAPRAARRAAARRLTGPPTVW